MLNNTTNAQPTTNTPSSDDAVISDDDCSYIKQLKEMLQELGAETKMGQNVEAVVKYQGRGVLLILAATDWKNLYIDVDPKQLDDGFAELSDEEKASRAIDPRLDGMFDVVTQHFMDRKQVPEIKDLNDYPTNDALVNHIRLKHMP